MDTPMETTAMDTPGPLGDEDDVLPEQATQQAGFQTSNSGSPADTSPIQQARFDPELVKGLIKQLINAIGGTQSFVQGLVLAVGGKDELIKQLLIQTGGKQLDTVQKLRPEPIKIRLWLGQNDAARLRNMKVRDILAKARVADSEWQGVHTAFVKQDKLTLKFKSLEAKARIFNEGSLTRLFDLSEKWKILGDEFQVQVIKPRLDKNDFKTPGQLKDEFEIPDLRKEDWAKENGIGIDRTYFQGDKLILSLQTLEDAKKSIEAPFSLDGVDGFVM